jgi:dodecin
VRSTSHQMNDEGVAAAEGAAIRFVELLGSSPQSFGDAVRDAVRTTARTVRHIRSVDVLSQHATVGPEGDIETFVVACKIGFVQEPPAGSRLGEGRVLPAEGEG